eukprot:54154-Eustigmatos_ZCMA.PRE.1
MIADGATLVSRSSAVGVVANGTVLLKRGARAASPEKSRLALIRGNCAPDLERHGREKDRQ